MSCADDASRLSKDCSAGGTFNGVHGNFDFFPSILLIDLFW
jgi:hypothetical protein